ncbi:MAG TPA: MoaD/ThiS family protein [Saprospiraceae bacterium]|nr:MoaD/ThiS family protein [Saprospiraceae bacterium]
MAKIIIPTPLRKFTGNLAQVETAGSTIREALTDLATRHQDLRKHLLDEQGDVRSFIRIYLGDEDINQLEKSDTRVETNSVISIVPAIAGGKN